jgi:hypothetical protein
MDLAPDFDEFIGSLIAHDAQFVVVGAYALALHGAPRFTGGRSRRPCGADARERGAPHRRGEIW